jgi:branched-chain amino acid transport system ATP-binding protein
LQVPEGRGIIGRLTVAENLQLAWALRPDQESFEAACRRVFARFPRLQERLSQRAGSMSGGEQQMLALARAIISPPRVLLVDEPSLGLSPVMVSEVFSVLKAFRESGVTILLVEQNVRQALAIADRAYVLRQGGIVAEGSGQTLLADPAMLRYYLGAS